MNILRLDDSDLVPVDYGDLLDKILEVLQAKNPFNVSDDRRRLIVDLPCRQVDGHRQGEGGGDREGALTEPPYSEEP